MQAVATFRIVIGAVGVLCVRPFDHLLASVLVEAAQVLF